MSQWYVKDLSKLTQVSVQTLHHYDRIGLLKPSIRQPNGYRTYSEKDLLKLQQIIALKFFGFELSQIKMLLDADVDVIAHFAVQSQFLEEKAKSLTEASKTLKRITSECNHNKSIPWETIIELIEVYRMTQQLEKTWAGKVLSPEELKEYASFEHDLKSRFTETGKKNFEKAWDDLIADVNRNLSKNPTSDIGIATGKRCMDLVNTLYGKKHITLRNAIWEKGFKSGQMDEEHALPKEVVNWLDKAIDAYYRNRIFSVLSKVETYPHTEVLQAWEELLTDMCGDKQNLRKDIVDAVMKEDGISIAAKNWVRKVS